jgi:hypothetical protein
VPAGQEIAGALYGEALPVTLIATALNDAGHHIRWLTATFPRDGPGALPTRDGAIFYAADQETARLERMAPG